MTCFAFSFQLFVVVCIRSFCELAATSGPGDKRPFGISVSLWIRANVTCKWPPGKRARSKMDEENKNNSFSKRISHMPRFPDYFRLSLVLFSVPSVPARRCPAPTFFFAAIAIEFQMMIIESVPCSSAFDFDGARDTDVSVTKLGSRCMPTMMWMCECDVNESQIRFTVISRQPSTS